MVDGAPPDTPEDAHPDAAASGASTEAASSTSDAVAAASLRPTVVPSPGSPRAATVPPAVPLEDGWRYEIRVEIARGGMGRVVEATDTVLGRTVALKEALSLDPETVRRFQRETQITARLEHPAIVPVHDAGVSPTGAPYYVMRKIGGRALEDLVARASELSQRLALVPHVVAAAHAIAHAHARGIVHRDIKPSNILVGELGETIVIDWGLAKAIGEAEDPAGPVQRVLEPDDDPALKTRAGIVFGTPGFMAPEQLRGAPVDERCDVYALGATLYHLLARRPPHHHKNAEVMMRATADGPPAPLAALVDGVPPELATIVDKALAHDHRRRYQNAGLLAEDLQRFLTGQLVASHHYSARERFARFLRKHRGAVGIAVGSLVAIVAVVAFAFLSVTEERDRADEQATIARRERDVAQQQREEVVRKARELTLTNARHASTTDPTRAAAMVKPLVASELWRAARDVGAAARAHGVAFSIPASPRTLSLELSRDGGRALAAGDDGVVRVVDLERRTSKEIANVGGAILARYADGDRKVVLYQGNRITVLDPATGDSRDLTAPTPIEQLEVSGPLVYWVDPAGSVWRLDLAGGAPVQVPIGERVRVVMPSPDGRWLAFGGEKSLLLADRSNPSLPPDLVSQGVTHEMRWSADSRRLAVQIDNEVIDVNTQPAPQVFDRFLISGQFGLAYSGGKIFGSGPTGVRQLSRSDSRVRVPDPEHKLGVHEGRDRVIISAKPQGEIVVLSEYGDHALKVPVSIDRVATSTRGPWITAATEGQLLVWNLDGFEPKAFDSYAPASARFVTGDVMLVTYVDDAAEWIDLRTRKVTSLGRMPAIETVIAAPDGAEAIAIDATRRAWRVAGVGKPQALPGDTVAASFVDNGRLVLASDGELRLDDLRTQQGPQVLLAHASELRDLATSASDGGWVAASFGDGLVWRTQLNGSESRLQLPAGLTPTRVPVGLMAGGLVVLGVGTELRTWASGGAVEAVARTTSSILEVVGVDRDRVVVLTEDGTAQLVDVRARETLATLPSVQLGSIAGDGSLLAGRTGTGGVEVLDLEAGWRWPLATPTKGVHPPYSYVEIARDGSRVLAMTQDSVVVWTLELPHTAEETAGWLDRMTNAEADLPTAPLVWK